MFEKRKALRLALLMTLALGALAAAALAGEGEETVDSFKSESNDTVLTGNSIGEPNVFRITNPNIKVECFVSTFAGTVENPPVQEVTIRPTYSGTTANHGSEKCESGAGEITVDMGECDYMLTGRTNKIDEEKVDAEVKIECPGGAEIKLTAPGCTILIPSQVPKEGGVTYENGEGGDITVTATVTGIKYETEGALCSLAGLPKTGENADYLGTITVFGYEDEGTGEAKDEFIEGKQVGIEVS